MQHNVFFWDTKLFVGGRMRGKFMKVGEANVYINLNVQGNEDAKQGKTIFAGGLNTAGNILGNQNERRDIFGRRMERDDAIEQRRQKAVKDAVKMVTDTWKSESGLDDSIEESKTKLAELEEKSLDLIQTKKDYQEQIAEYENNVNLTDEEKEASTAGLYEAVKDCEKKIAGNAASMEAGRRSIEDIKVDRLKEAPMVEAKVKEEAALKAAAEDAAYSMMQEGVDNINEKIEEVVEAVQEKKEEEEEEKEAEAAKEEREAAMDPARRKPETSDKTSAAANNAVEDQLSAKLQKIRQDNLLVEDDMLGIMVDSLI